MPGAEIHVETPTRYEIGFLTGVFEALGRQTLTDADFRRATKLSGEHRAQQLALWLQDLRRQITSPVS